MSFSVIILSRNPDNLVPCIRRVLEKEAWMQRDRIIVVDDGAREKAEPELARRFVECEGRDIDVTTWSDHSGITWVTGAKPFVFARNANRGIVAAGRNDVILLNDDALLETERGFTDMWEMSTRFPEYGVIGATCNNVGNPNQMKQPTPYLDGIRFEPRMVCYTCVLIPRTTIEKVGLLDERFSGYGLDDDDYCLRVRKAGLSIGVFDGCYLDHGSLTSSYRGNPAAPADFGPNLQRYIAKHGEDNWGRKVEKVA